MTRSESMLETAIQLKNNGELNDKDAEFVESIECFNKKDLRGLNTKSFKTLERIANS